MQLTALRKSWTLSSKWLQQLGLTETTSNSTVSIWKSTLTQQRIHWLSFGVASVLCTRCAFERWKIVYWPSRFCVAIWNGKQVKKCPNDQSCITWSFPTDDAIEVGCRRNLWWLSKSVICGLWRYWASRFVHSGWIQHVALPPYTLSKKFRMYMRKQVTTKWPLGTLKWVGLMNTQFAIKDNEV